MNYKRMVIMKNKKMIFVVLLLILGILFFMRMFTPEDTWICDNGEWIKHGNPSKMKPKTECKQ